MRYQTRVRKFAKEARARLLKNEYEKPAQKMPSNRVFKMAKDPREDKLYEIVCQMALSSEIITNPIARLIDDDAYNLMNQTEKTKYVFNLSNKYISLLEKRRCAENSSNLVYASVLN